jgi:hypothetical protein
LEKAQTPLARLPFVGALNRVGHASPVSRSRMVVRQFFNRDLLKHPRELLRRVSRLRLLTPALRRDFFGA